MTKRFFLAGLVLLAILFWGSNFFKKNAFASCDGSFDGCVADYSCGSYATIQTYGCSYSESSGLCVEPQGSNFQADCNPAASCGWSASAADAPWGCSNWSPPPGTKDCFAETEGRGGNCCNGCPACVATTCDAVCPASCGYGGGSVPGTDNCGDPCSISCGATAACCEAVNGGWSAWSPACSTCGGDAQTRSCNNPSPSCGGADCSGSSSQTCAITAPVCTDPATVCSGTAITSSNGCGTCPSGTLGPVCANPATVCSGTPITSSNGCDTSTCVPGSSCACAAGTKCDTPATPTLNSPVGGTEVAGTSIPFSWNAPGYGTCSGGGGTYNHCVDGSCTNVGNVVATSKTAAAGSHSWYVNAVNTCGVTGANSVTGTFCAESWTSARVSAWNTFGFCSAGHVRTRTRTCTEDCSTGVADCSAYFAANCPAGSSCATTGGGLSWTQTETQTCYGQMTGTFFDASDLAVCPATPQTDPAPKIPGGTMSLTGPTSYGPYTTDGTGLYTTVATVLSPDTYTLSVDPGGGYITAAKLNCQGTTLTLTGSATSCLTQPCETAPITTHDYGFWRVYGGWWQTVGGSAYGGSGIESNIPGTVAAADRYLILADADSQDGLAQIKSGTINLGTFPGITNSVSDWNATSGYSGDNMDYYYFVAKMGSYSMTNLNSAPIWNGTSKPAYTPGGNDYEIYKYTGDVTMNWSPGAGEKVIYLIKGNVTVSANIAVTTASPTFLAVIASGTITFNSSVTNVDGWWIGNSLVVASAGVKSDTQFVGNGTFVGWSSITLSRDQTGILNNTQPAEIFTFRPDLVINAPAPLSQSKYQWRQE